MPIDALSFLPPTPDAAIRQLADRLGGRSEPSSSISSLASRLGGSSRNEPAPSTPAEISGGGGPAPPRQEPASASPQAPARFDRDRILIHDASRRDAGEAPRFLGTAADSLPASGPESARQAQRTVGEAMDYLARNGRDGVRDDGGELVVRVEDTTRDHRGGERHQGGAGYYTDPATAIRGNDESLRYGRSLRLDRRDGKRWESVSFTGALDVTLHELTHGIIKAETGHPGGGANESGASHEALADMLAAAATRDWEIGEAAFGPGSDIRALRDIANPDRDDVGSGLYDHVHEHRADAADGHAQEHVASGVLSRAGFRIQQRIGWDPFERLVWGTLEGGRLGGLGFAEVAAAMRAAAHTTWGSGDARSAVVDEELRRAGL